MKNSKVAIVGAGISGLYCARILAEQFDVTVFEASDQIGGRIKTDDYKGCLLDHGFQVFQPAYPEAQRAFNYRELELQYFDAGANILVGRNFFRVADPFREPASLISTILAPIGSPVDKLRILKLRFVDPNDDRLVGKTAIQFLRECGFGDKIIERFFRPFFSGVFLERKLESPASFFAYLYRLFSISEVAVPRFGMQMLPTQLIADRQFNICFNEHRVPKELLSEFDYVVQAYGDGLGGFRKVTTDYFVSDTLEADRPMLYLNGNRGGCINHIAPVSRVSSSYSSGKQSLWSVNLLDNYCKTSPSDVRRELSEWFPDHDLQHLKRYYITKALPIDPNYASKSIFRDGIFHCSDSESQPSIQGALIAGRRVAELIFRKVGSNF